MLISNKNSNFWFKIAAPLNATAIFYFQFETITKLLFQYNVPTPFNWHEVASVMENEQIVIHSS